MDVGTISSRYTRALFSLAKDEGKETRVYQDMKMLAESFFLEPELKGALVNPVVTTAEKEQLLTAAGGIDVCDLYQRFIRLVLSHKRENILPFIAQTFIQLYRKDKNIIQVQFSTAVPVRDEVRQHLLDKLKKETGSTIEFSGHINPGLIGGFRLRIGNFRIDSSYATQLKDIRTQLLEIR